VVERLYADPARVAAANAIDTPVLAALLRRCIVDAERTVIDERAVLDLFGVEERRMPAGELWQRLAAREDLSAHREPLDHIFARGTLATRLRQAVNTVDRSRLELVYRTLRDCLAEGRAFDPSGT
jgi:hypothetical protein